MPHILLDPAIRHHLAGLPLAADPPPVPSATAEERLSPEQAQVFARQLERLKIPRGFAGHRLLSHLGTGRRSVVFKARLEATGTLVAFKVLWSPTPDRWSSSELAAIHAAGQLRAPHLAGISAHGRIDGKPYLVLEYLPGGDLRSLLARQGGRLAEDHALALAHQCARGLESLHGAGLIHRDLGPRSVLLTSDGAAKLAEPGLAATPTADDVLALPTHRIDAPAYLSPEQADGWPDLDVRSDIYSLGATLFHLVTGRAPFTGSDPREVLRKVLRAQPPDPGMLREGLRESTCRIIARAMARRREERYRSVAALRRDLGAVLDGDAASLPSERASRWQPQWWTVLTGRLRRARSA
jgi:serine/threonine protein kinase